MRQHDVAANPKTPAPAPAGRGVLQRQCACGQHTPGGGECPACQKAGRALTRAHNDRTPADSHRDSAVPSSVQEVLQTTGRPLDSTTRAFMESRFDHDFSRVRVHTDSRAAESARAVDALAYTVGHDVVFGAGQFAPDTSRGSGLIAHELTHTIQQSGNTGTLPLQMEGDERHEREADQAGAAIANGEKPTITGHASRAMVQRKGGTIGGFFANIGRAITDAFTGSEQSYDETTLREYLQTLNTTGSIEDDYDSDNKARAVVKRWKAGDAKFNLTARQKGLLIKEMQSGFTGDEDEQAILDLLENSSDGDLRTIFGPGLVNVKALNVVFHGEEWKHLQAFYAARFKGGMDALLKGVVELSGKSPVSAPKFPYSWPIIQAKIEGPYDVSEIVADLNALSPTERDRALKDIGEERIRKQRLAVSLKDKRDSEPDALKKKQFESDAIAARDASRKMDIILQPVFKDIALAETPASLAGKTSVPTSAEKAEIGKALKPDLRVNSSGGVVAFAETLPGESQSYEDKLRALAPGMINQYYQKMVVGRGKAEHSDPTKVHSLTELENIGNVSREETNKVFGSYKIGPALKADKPASGSRRAVRGNIHDLWQDTETSLGVMTKNQKREMAKQLVKYFFQSNRDVLDLNRQHNADPQFVNKVASNKEAKILAKLANEFTATEADVKRLNEIDRGWDASANDGNINTQLFKKSDADADRDFLWDMFQVLIHEYLHTLEHPTYHTYAESFGEDSNQYNTLVEGVDSLLDEVVWANIEPRVNDPALRAEVEGPTYSSLPPMAVKPASRRRYPSYTQAVKLVNVVGIRNLYAAFFLGKTDLIGK